MKIRALTGTALLLASVALAGCTPRPVAATAADAAPQHKDYPMEDTVGRDPHQTPPPLRDANVGPHRFRIPANYFENQMGPEHDGSFALFLEYPTLEPFEPGARRPISLDILARQVVVLPGHVRSEIDTYLSRTLQPEYVEPDHPSKNLELRLSGDPIFGLQVYYTDLEAVAAYAVAKGGNPKTWADPKSLFNRDWYVRHDKQGELATVIKCRSRPEREGDPFKGGQPRQANRSGFSDCTHTLIVKDLDIGLSIMYARAFLHDWERIEDRARMLIFDFKQDARSSIKE